MMRGYLCVICIIWLIQNCFGTVINLESHLKIVVNHFLQKEGNFDVVLLTNNNTDLARDLAKNFSNGLSVSIHTPGEGIENLYPFKITCEKWNYQLEKHPKLVITLLNSIETAKKALYDLSGTITSCPNFVRPGFYHPNNVIVHYITSDQSLTHDMIWNDEESRRHPHVLALHILSNNMAKISRFDGFTNLVLSHPLTMTSASNLHIWLDPLPMKKKVVRVVSMPYNNNVIGEIVPNGEDIRKSIKVHGGFEVDILGLICEYLNCQMNFSNPADFAWGGALDEPFGFVKDILDGRADVGFGAMGMHFGNIRASRFAGSGLSDAGYFAMASPIPASRSSSPLRLLHPFTSLTWLAASVVMASIPFLLVFVARMENQLTGMPPFLAGYESATWFVFASLCGENITLAVKYRETWAIRSLCLAWLICTFVLSTSYSGNLRAVLVTPFVDKPIETLAQLVNSDLKWNMLLYGEIYEREMEESNDKVIKTIWDKKIVMQYSSFPYQEMKSVYLGKSAMLDWTPTLDMMVETGGFSLANGKPLFHVSPHLGIGPGVAVFTTWIFHPLSQLAGRFDRLLMRMLECGIVRHFQKKSSYQLKQKHLQILEKQGEISPAEDYVLKAKEKSNSSMTVEDLEGVFWFFLASICFSALLFTKEVISKKKCSKMVSPLDKYEQRQLFELPELVI